MSGCPFNRCDGSGVIVVYPEPMAGMGWTDTETCACATRATVPARKEPSERDKCAAWGCHGCPACVAGYVP